MGYLEGLLSGFMGRKGEYEAERLAESQRAQAQEARIFQTLLSSPDAEVRNLAAAGLLESATPRQRKGGLRGWIGELESSPYLEKIRALSPEVDADWAVPGTVGGIAAGQTQLATPPGASLAQPATSPTQGGGMATPVAAPAPGLAATPPTTGGIQPTAQTADRATTPPTTPGIQAPPTPMTTSTVRVRQPREIFLSPEEAIRRNKMAATQGDVEGEIAGLVAAGVPVEQARAAVLAKYQRMRGLGTGGVQSIAGEMPDGTPAFGVFDRVPGSPTFGKYLDPDTGQPLDGFRPRTTTGSTSLGADREAIARARYGKPYARLTQTEQQAVLAEEITRGGVEAGTKTTARGEAAAGVPLSTAQRFTATSDLSKQWQTAAQSYHTMQGQYALMQTGLARYDADPIGASQAVLVTFQKVLDPTSVVRESEYARSPQGLSLMDWLEGKYEQYKAGGVGVPKPILEQMVKTAEAFLRNENLRSGLDNVRQRLYKTATDYDIDPYNVMGPEAAGVALPRTSPAGAGAPPPAAGAKGAPASPVGTPPPGVTAPAPTGPGSDWTMVNGVLHYKGKPYQ